jgi:hypothetical protein
MAPQRGEDVLLAEIARFCPENLNQGKTLLELPIYADAKHAQDTTDTSFLDSTAPNGNGCTKYRGRRRGDTVFPK